MSNKTTEIYNYIAKLYQTNLKSTAEGIEKQRKILAPLHQISNILLFASIIMIFLSIIVIILVNCLYQGEVPQNILAALWIFLILICLPAGAICATLRIALKLYYNTLVKRKIFNKIYQSLDKNLKYIPGGFKLPLEFYEFERLLKFFKKPNDISFMLEEQIRNLNTIFPVYDYIRIDDVILGKYEGRDVKIIEFSLIERHVYYDGRRRVKYIENFHGALFQTTMEKQVNTNVFIKQKGSNLKCPYGLNRVILESNEFEKIFETYSYDQIESRYFLNTTTIQNFIDLNNAGQKISSYINGNKVNLMIHSSEDMFEPDIYKQIDNPNNYFEIIFQAKVILDMITKLKLESKTGL